MTLPDNHLLRKAWQTDVMATRLRHFSPKCQPKNQPSNNPLTCLKAMGTISEQFLEFDMANRRGDHMIDHFADRISYLTLTRHRRALTASKIGSTASGFGLPTLSHPATG